MVTPNFLFMGYMKTDPIKSSHKAPQNNHSDEHEYAITTTLENFLGTELVRVQKIDTGKTTT